MKYYDQLLRMGCYSRNDLVQLTGSADTANALIYSYKKKGLIKSVKRNLFVTISLETGQPVASRYAIASHAASDAFVTHHSAFEYHGYGNQVFYEIYIGSRARFRTFEFDGTTYRPLPYGITPGIDERADGVRVTDIERTTLDSIHDFERIGGLEELLRCLMMVPYLDAGKMVSYLEAYGSGYLYRKAGYVLEYFKEALYLPSFFFEKCKDSVTPTKQYLYKSLINEPSAFNSDYRLYVPPDLMAAVRKGGTFDEPPWLFGKPESNNQRII